MMNTTTIQHQISKLLSQLGDNYEATLIIRDSKDHTNCRLITTEESPMKIVDTLTYLSKRHRENKEKLI